LARLALDELDVPRGPILNNEDRSPRWPDGVIGSLTHTDIWCGVALAKREHAALSLGIDMERLGSVSPEVERRIFTERELRDNRSVDPSIRFSAKESLYKAIYPLVRRFVGFGEVEIELTTAREFVVRIVSPELRAELARVRLNGVYATRGQLCCTAVIAA
jgi:4'-phosphopantetheinyl transferase EntD